MPYRASLYADKERARPGELWVSPGRATTESMVRQDTEGSQGGGGGGHGLSNDMFSFVFCMLVPPFRNFAKVINADGKAEATTEKYPVDWTTLAVSKNVVYKVRS